MVNDLQEKKNVVILGAGFAGLRVAQDLAKNLHDDSYQIILVDKKDVHLYTPDLYEIAAAFNPQITQECLMALKETVATPICDLIDAKNVQLIRDEVIDIQPKNRSVLLKHTPQLKYEILVVCLGSKTNYFGIPGLKEHSQPVKTIKDALSLNCHLDMLFQQLWQVKGEKNMNIVIGGGGATGVEVAGELVGCTKKLCKKYQLTNCNVQISIVEAGNILAALDEKGTSIVKKELEKRGVKVLTGHKITSVEEKFLTLETENKKTKKLDSSVLIWTGGVMVNPVVAKALGQDTLRGAIAVNENLTATEFKNIFAAGDNAFFTDPATAKRVPMLAQAAMAQGKILAQNIICFIQQKPLKPYHVKLAGYLLPIGSTCILKLGNRVFSSRVFWILKRFVAFRYFCSIMPWWKAFRKSWHGGEIFLRNDG